jgi:hypothetical protein
MASIGWLALTRMDLAALLRAAYARQGFAVLLGFAGFAAAVPGLQGRTGMQGWLFVAYVVVPTLFGLVASHCLAGPRSSRLVEALATTPLARSTHLAARASSSFALGLLYFLGLAPLVALAASTIGLPFNFWQWQGVGLAVLAASVAVGMSTAVLLPRSAAAAVGLAGGILTVSVLALPMAMMLARIPERTGSEESLLRLGHVSLHVLALESMQLPLGPSGEVQAAEPWRAAVLLAGIVALLIGLSALLYLKAQDIQGWARAGPLRVASTVALAALVLAGPAGASTSFEPAPAEPRFPGLGETFHMSFVAPGGATDARTFLPLMGVRDTPLLVGEARAVEFLVLVDVPDDATVQDLVVEFQGHPSIDVTPSAWRLPSVTTAESGAIPRYPPSGQSGTARMARLPATVLASGSDGFSGDIQDLRFEVSASIDGQASHADVTVPAWVGLDQARAKVAVAALPAPLLAAASWTARRIRTRGGP